MPEKIFDPKPPRGLSRIIFRLPILLFRGHLGWLLGHRFVMLTHKGRISGQLHQTVLEIVRYDNQTGACIVASGWGEKSDWVKNISKDPKIVFQIKNKITKGIAKRLSPEESAKELDAYARLHPIAFQELTRFMGYQLDGSGEDIRAMGEMIPMFLFTPVDN
jgi:deazaflavin-dependent oxidoreductase (nitroreductase family)